MSDDRVFLMGKYEARIPGDRLYSRNHLWLQPADDGGFRVGFTAYSVKLLNDVYFLDWSIDADTAVREKQPVGEIESSKALSTLYAPCEGRIIEFNQKLLDDPSGINADGYGHGWLFRMETQPRLLTADDYVSLLESTWDETERMLKGQANQQDA